MKPAVVFTFLIASITAVPETEVNLTEVPRAKLVSKAIVKAIDFVSEAIQRWGLDPYHTEKKEFYYELPVPVIFNVNASFEDFWSRGLSNIVVHKMRYSLLTSRLTFQIELPRLDFSVGASSLEATLFGRKFDAKASGSVHIRGMSIDADIRVKVGPLSGFYIRSADISLGLGGIDSYVNLIIQGKDYSDKVNKFLSITVPKNLRNHSDELSELLEYLLMAIGNLSEVFSWFFMHEE